MFKPIIFVVATGLLFFASRASLRSPGSHGFYRFFAWEAILGLLLRNVNVWWDDPFTLHQIVAWTFLLVSIVLAIHGAFLLKARGRPDERRGDPSLLGFEKTTSLVIVGAYRYIRHPLYSSLLFLAWGIYLKLPDIPASVLVLIASVFLFLTARADEAECMRFFGAEYEAYMRRTRRFIPFVL
jgi:protein-S-isoprenylcysteine O-methyltransferase Ste14